MSGAASLEIRKWALGQVLSSWDSPVVSAGGGSAPFRAVGTIEDAAEAVRIADVLAQWLVAPTIKVTSGEPSENVEQALTGIAREILEHFSQPSPVTTTFRPRGGA